MQISNYFNEEEKMALNERKWHSYAENLITCSDYKNACTDMKRKKGNRKGRQISLNIEMEHGSVRIVQEGQHL